ncbi:MAG: hypothetical protein HQL19_00575 [Candidatus Omnitrophica bacterium]|nr:hypothetical protein [Candidatus Omnitrophota bacterium]
MEPISLTTMGVIALSMAAGAMLANLCKGKSSCAAPSKEEAPAEQPLAAASVEAVDADKEKAIDDLIAGKQ